MQIKQLLSDQIGASPVQLVIKCLIIAVACLALFIFAHSVFDLVRYLAYRFRFCQSFIPRSWLVVAVAGIWSMLMPNRIIAMSVETSASVSEGETSSRSRQLSQINSLLTCSVVVAGLLFEIGKMRGRQLCKLEINSRLGHPSAAATLTELSLRAIKDSDVAPVSSIFLKLNFNRPIFIPIGESHTKLVHIDISQGSAINIIGDNPEGLKSVFNAILISALFVTKGQIQLIVFKRTLSEFIPVPGLQFVSSINEAIQLASEAKIQSVLFSYEQIETLEFNQLQTHQILTVCLNSSISASSQIEVSDNNWQIFPEGISFSPFGLTNTQIALVSELFLDVVRCADESVANADIKIDHIQEWKVLVRTLGPVDVQLADGTIVEFEKAKTKELLAWLTNHRSRPTRSAARTALWEFNVADATFTNVVSDIRRTLKQTQLLENFEEWIPRTFTDQLPFHNSIVSDGEVLQACVANAQKLEPAAAVAELHRGLELVRDLPFAGTGYLWPDAEGITSQLVLNVITAAVMAGELDLVRGDIDGVFWATAQGLKVLGAHEELFSLRMRAHALRGDLAGVRFEFESHKRAISADSFSIYEPSKKLVELLSELTSELTSEKTISLAR